MARFLLGVLGLALVVPALLLAIGFYGATLDEPYEFDFESARQVRVGEPTALVPGPGIPGEARIDRSTNNLDVTRFGDRFFLAVRTAPHHFATDEARILVLSSPDRRAWKLETEIDLERRDLREPRFLVFGDRLFLYFVELGDDPLAFRPISIRWTRRDRSGRWSESERMFEEGHVVWRVLEHDGRAWMSVYHGARLYDDLGEAGAVRLLVSDDGQEWVSISGAASPIDFPGASECAFQFDSEGNLVALVRVESYGAMVCTAPADRLTRWDCTPTRHRHDSPLLLREGDAFWAVARRSLGGAFATGQEWLPGRAGLGWSMLRYSATRKRTALYWILPEERRSVPVLDLPSRGDTAFASNVALGGGRHWIVNYTSPLDGRDWPWIGGQLLGSVVVGLEIELPPDGPRPPARGSP